jgi:molybdopterin/thiamine biosynthesis adenylyltransferase
LTAAEETRGPVAHDDGAFGDRHLRADPEGKLDFAAAPVHARVRVILEVGLGRTLVGQLGVWLCVNLLARLDGLVTEIELDCPKAEPVVLLKKLMSGVSSHSDLASLLCDTCTAVSAGRARLIESHTVSAPTDAPVAIQIVIGHQARPDDRIRTVWCVGSGWLAYSGSRPPAPVTARSEAAPAAGEHGKDANPLGLYVGVCYGVAEVFKSLRGVRPGALAVIEEIYFSLWTGEIGRCWDDLDDGPPIESLRVPAGYLVGAGAVGQAVALAIATATAGAELLTVIDEEAVDRDNRNRYVLTCLGDEGKSKAQLVAHMLRVTGTPAHGEDLNWLPYATRAGSHPNSGLAALERDLRYELVISCVDSNLARQEIQQFWPRDLIGGSTDGLRALAVHYDLRTPTACLLCHNPVNDFEREATRLRREVAGKPTELQRACLVRLGFAANAVTAVLEYLERPRCGELGEAAVKKFAEKGPPAFSVGFVSVAAGLLVARQWIRYACLGPAAICPPGQHYLALNFFNGRALWTEQGAREACCCQSEGRPRWREMWASGPAQ